ncbi:hypothetical protein FE257_010368 [Aspergillus nanangensis]|uniref:Fe2OG dioxygenase domain-containing protein n=1 Tax=Aspergillus nanangensis TaxID=2582783 RepID=A0AAD4CIQ7_ASPNN|nr:hypothetical protein FE257_010368 [Aspergillus nanangensis]
MNPIKTLDYGHWVSGDDTQRKAFAKSLHDQLVELGFLKLKNYGMSDDYVDHLFNLTEEFFKLPYEDKKKIAYFHGPKLQRGWSSLGSEKSATLDSPENQSHADLHDAKEHFDCGAAEDAAYPNQWPDASAIDGFQHGIEHYFDQCQKIGLNLMEALEMGFDLPPRCLQTRFAEHASQLRLNHYPPIQAAKLKDGSTNRLWPHTDYGILTFLLQDTVGGLEIWDNVNQAGFIPVPTSPRREMIVNAGGTLERLTNDFLKAGLHRVVSPATADDEGMLPGRYSIAFFLHTSRTTSAAPLPSFISADHPSLYEDITTFEFERRRTEKTYKDEAPIANGQEQKEIAV